MGNKVIVPTMLSEESSKKINYIPVNVLHYITTLEAKGLSDYIVGICNKYGLDERAFGQYIEDDLATKSFDNARNVTAYIRGIIRKSSAEKADMFRKEYRKATFNTLNRALDNSEIYGTRKERVMLELIENHLLNEFMNVDEIKQMNHNIVNYMVEHNEHDISRFIYYIKHSRYVSAHANIPFDIFEKTAEREIEEWNAILEETKSE